MSAGTPKILFFVSEDWFVCSHWLPLIAGARATGFEVGVVTRVQAHAGVIEQQGGRVIPFEMSRRGAHPWRELVVLWRLARIYHTEQPDLVHHVAMKPMLYGSLVARLLRVPHVVNWVAGMGWLFVSPRRQARLLRALVQPILGRLLRPTAVIVENADDRQIIEGMGVAGDHIHTIRGAGVDMARFAPSPEPEGTLLVVLPARMLWDKGVGEFVEAARLLRARGVEARFALVGDVDEGNPASVSRQQLADWHDEGCIEWWGRREDMPQVLAQAHVVCLPSYREGLPKALLEAASCARAIVTTDVPGCREVVRHGDNGLRVPVRDALALAQALASLLDDAVLRQSMGLRGRARVEAEFSEAHVVRRMLTVYRGMMRQ
jgi:glycosyltransferase involved in cell wall biosynthesis